MATKLKNLKIKKVDFVDNGANPGASIALYKSKPAEGEAHAVKPEEDTPPEESFLKRIVHAIAKSIGATDAQADAAVEEVSKNADVPTFGDAMARRRMRQTTEEIWDYCYALNDSLCGIVANADITAEEKKALMAQSCAEFATAAEAAIPKWSGGIPVKLEKAAPAPLTPDRIENAKAARARLDEMIAKAEPKPATEDTPPEPPKEGTDPTPPAEPQQEEEPVQKGAFDMEIDKSKLSPEEVAQLEAIEKKAGIPAQAAPAAPAGVEKSAPATTADNTAGGTAYNDMIGVLDANLEAVQKSGAFSEIGKRGGDHSHTTTGADDAWSQIEKRAEEIRKSAPTMGYYEAIDQACQQNPELVHEYENGR